MCSTPDPVAPFEYNTLLKIYTGWLALTSSIMEIKNLPKSFSSGFDGNVNISLVTFSHLLKVQVDVQVDVQVQFQV